MHARDEALDEGAGGLLDARTLGLTRAGDVEDEILPLQLRGHAGRQGARDNLVSHCTMKNLGAGWMIHVQHVEYKNQAFLGDEIRGTTWVAAYGRVACLRKCQFERISDGKVIFESETQWVLVDLNRGRPMAITDEMKKLYVEGV